MAKILTYSSIKTFKDCRQKFKYRYVDELSPRKQIDALNYGTIIHDALAQHYGGVAYDDINAYIRERVAEKEWSGIEPKPELSILAMFNGYAHRYPVDEEDFDVIKIEDQFEAPLINPNTNRKARKYGLSGKIDMLVKRDGHYWLVEHKTTYKASASYLEKIWTDFQIHLYAKYYGIANDIHIEGVLYNILEKSKLRRKGTTVKASVDKHEADYDYLNRLIADYRFTEKYVREEVILDYERIDRLSAQLWEIKDQIMAAELRLKKGDDSAFYQNESSCFFWGKPCSYYKICRANGSQAIIDFEYEKKRAHSELWIEEENTQ